MDKSRLSRKRLEKRKLGNPKRRMLRRKKPR
jgi:hypothetical protein